VRFGATPLSEAEGGILAHSLRLEGRRLAKGKFLTSEDINDLGAAGFSTVVVAFPDEGDVGEDMAACALAEAIVAGQNATGLRLTTAHTGRVNLIAEGPGVLVVDREKVNQINGIDAGVTLATLAPMTRVSKGLLAGTVKMIPYAVPGDALAEAVEIAPGALRVAPVITRRAGLILTEVTGQKKTLNDKGVRAVLQRCEALGIALDDVRTVPHGTDTIAEALTVITGEVVMILTGSATSDSRDTAPAAVRRAGGRVDRFGLPVDPGNLLFLGQLGDKRHVIGLPGCARSPALNGADWVLERVACGMPPSDRDFAEMGVGGLLKEIPIRPQPREASRKG